MYQIKRNEHGDVVSASLSNALMDGAEEVSEEEWREHYAALMARVPVSEAQINDPATQVVEALIAEGVISASKADKVRARLKPKKD